MARSWTPSQEAAMSIKGKNLLVSAAAGSGKTSVLTERIIRTLLDHDAPADLSRMLIVTFTRAAAAELKGRIAEALSEALAREPENEHLSRQLFLLGSAQISTIDSFFQKAVKANFEQLSLPATFRLADEKELMPIKDEVLSALLAAYYKKYDRSTEKVLSVESIYENDFARVLDHLMSGRSDGRLRETLLDFYEVFSSDPLGIDRLKKCAEELILNLEKDYFESSFGKEVHTYLLERFSEQKAYLETVASHLEADPYIAQKYGDAVYGDLTLCSGILSSLEACRYADTRALVADCTFKALPTGKIQKTPEIIEYQARRTKLKADVTKAHDLMKTPAEDIPAQMEETAGVLRMLHAFYTDYREMLLAQKRERGVFEHNDVRAMLFALLNEKDGSPTAFARTLASEYDAVYIDEYQDVDLIQDQIFARIGENNRFMVGDIKQSIYGFRGSEPSIFADYRRAFPLYNEQGAENADGVCVFMSDNFRCNEPVIRFANRVCAFLFSACEKSIGYREEDDLVFSKRMPEELPAGHPAPVRFAVFDPRKSASSEDAEEDTAEKEVHDEALWVAAEISRLLREEQLDNGERIKPSDIAILTQTRRPWPAYIKALEALRIPVGASVKSELLGDPILITALNLLHAVDNPYKDLPLTEFLLSTLGGFTLTELTELRNATSSECSMYDALLLGANGEGALAQKTKALLSWLDSLRSHAAVLPADRFLRLLFLDGRFVPYATTPALLFLYDQARLSQRSAFTGLYEFLTYFSKLVEDGKVSADGFKPAQCAVTLMSVHHSKGLEFPVVFVASTGTQFNKEDIKQTLVYHRDIGAATKLYNRENGNIEATALHDAVKLRIGLEGTEEHIRTLYVALTRARERLYVTGTLRGKWENALTSAKEIPYGSRAAILGVDTTLKWMLAAAVGADKDFPCRLEHYPLGSVEARSLLDAIPEEASEAVTADAASMRYARIKEDAADFVYPEELPHEIPSKLAASKLHRGILDTLTDGEDSAEALEAQIDLMRAAPTFETLLGNARRPSATDIGSAMHAFFEFCDFKELATHGVEAECKHLLEMGFLTEDAVTLLNKPLLEGFMKSDLMQWILEAKEYKREQKFSMFLPMEDLTENEALARRVKGQKIFVQGSIDLILHMKDQRILLIDYKTDRLTGEEMKDRDAYRKRLRTSHRDQLACYALAMEELFGTPPDDIYIYSIPLGETVSFSDKD
ncbi:MAG: hypothetical protein E7643_03155 [Ruminococcaceae bacterium]|nr:hypothetical protein [Oscillospiraceae bacterium]